MEESYYGSELFKTYVKYINSKLAEIDKEQAANKMEILISNTLSYDAVSWAGYYNLSIQSLSELQKFQYAIGRSVDILDTDYYYIESTPLNKIQFGLVWQETIQILESIKGWKDVNYVIDLIEQSEAKQLFDLEAAVILNNIINISAQSNNPMVVLIPKDEYHFYSYKDDRILTIQEAKKQLDKEYKNNQTGITEEHYTALQDALSQLEHYESHDFDKQIKEYHQFIQQKSHLKSEETALNMSFNNGVRERSSKAKESKIQDKSCKIESKNKDMDLSK